MTAANIFPLAPPVPKDGRERAIERDCQQTIVDAAKILGYKVLAIRPAIGRGKRWQSPIQGDPGYPDLTLVHDRGRVVMFVELKRAPSGKLTVEQIEWGQALVDAGAIYRLVWVPEGQDDFLDELAALARPRWNAVRG